MNEAKNPVQITITYNGITEHLQGNVFMGTMMGKDDTHGVALGPIDIPDIAMHVMSAISGARVVMDQIGVPTQQASELLLKMVKNGLLNDPDQMEDLLDAKPTH